jgi:hypothetical protein
MDMDMETEYAYDAVQERIDSTYPDKLNENDDIDVADGVGDAARNSKRQANKALILMTKTLLGSNEATDRHRLLGKPGPHITSKLFRPILEFLERARRLDR